MGDNSSKRLKTINELMAGVSAVDPHGNLWFFPTAGQPGMEWVLPPHRPNEAFTALQDSAHVLFKVAVNTRDMMTPLIERLEDLGADDTVFAVLKHQSALNFAIRCAIEGPQKVMPPKNNR